MRWHRCEGRILLISRCEQGISATPPRRGLLTTSCKLVDYFLLEEYHAFTRQLLQDTEHALAAEEAIEALVGIGVVLRATENSFSFRVDFLYQSTCCVYLP